MIKKILFILIFLSLNTSLFSQNVSNEIDSLKKEITNLKKDNDTRSTMESMKKEFQTWITVEVSSQIYKLGALIGIILTILGVFGFKMGDNFIKRRIETIVDETIKEEYKKIKEDYDRIEKEQGLLSEKFALKFALEDLLKDPDRFRKYDTTLQKIQQYTTQMQQIGDEDLVNKFVEEMFRFVFASGRDEDMYNLRIKFEKSLPFNYITWANIAISSMFLYWKSSAQYYKESAISACENSLKQLPSYGCPQAIRLIIHMIDYGRGDETTKEKEKKETNQLLLYIISGTDTITAYETCDYLGRYAKTMAKDIQLLYEIFPEHMKSMEEKYNEQKKLMQPKT